MNKTKLKQFEAWNLDVNAWSSTLIWVQSMMMIATGKYDKILSYGLLGMMEKDKLDHNKPQAD